MNKLNKQFINGEQKYLANVIVYAHTDNFLYADEKHTAGNTVDAETVLDLCTKGLLLVKNGTKFYVPVFFENASGTTSVTVVNQGSSVELKTFKSKDPAKE